MNMFTLCSQTENRDKPKCKDVILVNYTVGSGALKGCF